MIKLRVANEKSWAVQDFELLTASSLKQDVIGVNLSRLRDALKQAVGKLETATEVAGEECCGNQVALRLEQKLNNLTLYHMLVATEASQDRTIELEIHSYGKHRKKGRVHVASDVANDFLEQLVSTLTKGAKNA